MGRERTGKDSETGGEREKRKGYKTRKAKVTSKSLWSAGFLLSIAQSCFKLTERHRHRHPVQ